MAEQLESKLSIHALLWESNRKQKTGGEARLKKDDVTLS